MVKPSSLGDIVHAFPAAALLRQAMPGLELDWVAADSLAETAALCPGGLRRIIVFPRRQLHSFHLGCLPALVRELRRDEYDAVIDFQGLLRSGLMSRLARSPLRIGFAHAREGAPIFYNRKVALPPELRQGHAADKNLYLAREALSCLGVAAPPREWVPDAAPTLPAGWRDTANALLAANGLAGEGTLLAVAPSSRWASKSWPVDFFAAVLKELLIRCPTARVWLLGAPGPEVQRAAAVAERCGGDARIRNLAGQTTVTAMTALLAASNAMLTNDSGPMHIAAALRIPVVALFGATDPGLTGPYGPPGRHAVFRSQCPQSPCFRRECPRDGHPCPEHTPPAAVADAILARLVSP